MNIEDVAKLNATGSKNSKLKKAGYDDIEISESKSNNKPSKHGKTEDDKHDQTGKFSQQQDPDTEATKEESLKQRRKSPDKKTSTKAKSAPPAVPSAESSKNQPPTNDNAASVLLSKAATPSVLPEKEHKESERKEPQAAQVKVDSKNSGRRKKIKEPSEIKTSTENVRTNHEENQSATPRAGGDKNTKDKKQKKKKGGCCCS